MTKGLFLYSSRVIGRLGQDVRDCCHLQTLTRIVKTFDSDPFHIFSENFRNISSAEDVKMKNISAFESRVTLKTVL